MGVKIKIVDDGDGSKGYHIFCPACKQVHHFNDSWGFNGDINNPTVEGSLGTKNELGYCHGFITNGQISFGADSTHAMAGQTVELPDFPKNLSKQINDAC